MPMLWRVLYTVEQIIINEGLDFNLFELSHLYSLVSHGSHRFVFSYLIMRRCIPIMQSCISIYINVLQNIGLLATSI
ncbi:hypothetical protein Hanom_Chr03g00193991 [Helianthus anomalus]